MAEKKIGMITPFPPEHDGIAVYADSLWHAMGKGRKNVRIIGGIQSRAPLKIDSRSFALKANLNKLIEKEHLSLLHFQYVPSLFGRHTLNLNLLAAMGLPVKRIVTLHEVHDGKGGLKNRILERLQRAIIKKADAVIVHTPEQKEFLDEKYRSSNLRCILQGMEVSSRPKDSPKKKNLLFFGMISSKKGVPCLIGAMQYLPYYHLQIAGRFVDRGAEAEVMQALRKHAALAHPGNMLPPNNIQTDFGWISEQKKSEYYQNADLVVLPYTWAPYQSAVMQDALGHGLPVVVTDVGYLPEMVSMFNIGEVARPNNPFLLAEAIMKVFCSYKEYGKGILAYQSRASWNVVAKEHLRLYREVLQ
ncbi:glycosyltransferase family 4 protein [Candidatus Woesearchaeota archaeon]|nr:glycosyltransferase family 4 protein [Candidatus Woesearchaeota archaeon]